MKRVFSFIIPAAVAFTVAACGNGEKKEAKSPDSNVQSHEAHMPKDAPTATGGKPAIKDDRLHAIYEQYQQLTTALIDGKVAEAKIASNAIEAVAAQMKGGKPVATAASKITTASGLEAQRGHYASLSNSMIQLVKSSGVNRGELYIDYCPMALDDIGAYWLSAEKEIRNPYFGAEMLTCGEVKETIK